MTRFLNTLLKGTAACGLLMLSACGNPFSGHSDSATIPKNEFHTKTENCDQIRFDEEHLSITQLRSIVSCLNSGHDIEALDQLVRSLSDAELSPFTDLINSTTDLNPNVFFAIKEMYYRIQKDGRLTEGEALLKILFQDPKANARVAEALKALAPVIRNLIETQSLTISTESLSQISSSASFQRFVQEYNEPKRIHRFATALKDYLNAKDAMNVETLYRMLADSKTDQVFAKIAADPKRLQKLASFLEWMFSGNRFQRFSLSLYNIRTQKMVCFNGNIEIKTPLTTELRDLARMTPTEAKQYFTHDLKNLVLVSRGYCDIPYAVSNCINFLGEATEQPGYEEIFTLLQPLMADDRLTAFLSSDAARKWMEANQFLAEDHFFQDLLTMIAQSQRLAISNDGATVARILDRSLNAMSAQQIEDLILFLNPVLDANHQYGHQALRLIYSMVEEFPTLKTKKQPGLRERLAQFTETVLQRPQLASVLTLTSDLIRDQKLNSILDRTLMIFDQFLNRGRTKLEYGTLKVAQALHGDLTQWLLEKLKATPQIVDACREMVYEWDFSIFTPQNQTGYLKQLDLILACVNSNQTFKSARDLALYLAGSGNYPYVLSAQKSVINEMYILDQKLAFNTIDRFLDLSQDQSGSIRSALTLSSQVFDPLRPLLKKPELRSFLAREVKAPGLYETVAEYLKSNVTTAADVPSIDLAKLDRIDTQLDRDTFLSNEPFASAVDQMFKLYCPTLDIQDPSCDLDDDQVEAYKKSSQQLVASIKTEYLNSTQAWIHPKQFKGWNHTHEPAQKVSDFEFHLNPMLHLVRNGSNSMNSVFTAVERIRSHRFDLYRFLKDRALRLTLIPYIYQVPDYPVTGKREYHNRIRIRIASDLDRLELLAINADFKAFNLVQNMGMGFIREIGLSWGDLPKDQWPSSLAKLKAPNNVRTLAETRDYIRSEMGKFDKGIIQKMGECDPRGKGGLRRWFQRKLCSNEVFDISSRLFNLRFLITLLDREVAEKDNSSGGLAFLRDLFYSLYEANTASQFDQFSNGVETRDECLSSPAGLKDPNTRCSKDLLTLIPKITHLGLLHQVGVAILKNQDSATRPLVNTLNRLSSEKVITQKLASFLSTADGIKTFESGVDFGFNSGSKTADALSALVPLADLIPNQHWVSALIDLLRQYPEMLIDHQAVMEAALSGDGSTLRNIATSIQNNPNAKALPWIDALSLNLNDALISELASSLKDLKPKVQTLAPAIRSLYQVRPIDSPALTAAMGDWFDLIASEKGRNTRARLSTWVKDAEFEQFCDVFSDSQFVDKAYNLLEQIHQNPDSRDFFQSCKDFLNLP